MQMEMITDVQIDLYGELKYYMASAKQGDKGTRYIRVQLMNNGIEFQIPEDAIVIANIKKPDGKFCYNECVTRDNRVMVLLTNQALAAAGTAYCDIEMRDAEGELILSSAAFTIEIEPSMRNEAAMESSNEMTFIDKKFESLNVISREIAAMKQEVVEAKEIVEDTYENYIAALDEYHEKMTGIINNHVNDNDNPHGVNVVQLQLEQVDNTSDRDKPVSTAQQKALDELYQQLTAFTLQKIADLIGGAPTSMDTLKEVHDAIEANKTIMDALDAAIGKKASAAEFDSHAKDTTKHITAAERTAWNGKAAGSHTHSKSQITDFPSSLPASDVYSWAKAASKPSYSWSEINDKPKSFTPSSHTHDDRYYTEDEVDTKLNGKADSSHTHNAVAGHTFDLETANTTDTWLLVKKDNTIQHRDASTLPFLPKTGGTVNGDIDIGNHVFTGRTLELKATGSAYPGVWLNDWDITLEGSQLLRLTANDANYSIYQGVLDGMWTWAPRKNGYVTLGSPNHRWGQPYFSASPNVSSDGNLKKDITPISEQYLEFFALLRPVSYRFIDGQSGRIHIGFISQDVEAAMAQVGLSDLDFAGFCKDKAQREVRTPYKVPAIDADGIPILDEDGNLIYEEHESISYEDVLDADGNPTYIYSLRYEEFIALEAAVIQHQQKKFVALEERVAKIEEALCR